jgi:hypothetical protein
MSTVTLPRAGITPIGHLDPATGKVFLDPDWAKGFDQLVQRTGGTTSSTITDLSVSAFEDAGVAEQQAQLHSLDQTYGQVPLAITFHPGSDASSMAELQARVDALEAAVRALQQGAQA